MPCQGCYYLGSFWLSVLSRLWPAVYSQGSLSKSKPSQKLKQQKLAPSDSLAKLLRIKRQKEFDRKQADHQEENIKTKVCPPQAPDIEKPCEPQVNDLQEIRVQEKRKSKLLKETCSP